ncbi:hypothetical protein [Ideonella livida]|uniref:Carboxypeptidase regulatory-like domain-containing protein n=1 Tax=Ideonella livida TaxID=2707176 RepID=A0A7C9PK54_9BURK|nr:hypothetical protein [Ideonella livida]NDY92994.1 hypothetical protein [Ideonella livida]
MNKHWMVAALLGAALLSGCGSGGSKEDGGEEPPPASDKLTLTGVVTKGLMANAEVNVYAANPDGSLSTTPVLASPILSDSNGLYRLNFTPTAGQVYVVQVKAITGTTHLDEVTGERQSLPVGFTMRAPFIPSGSGTVTLTRNVTAFTEMAVSAAQTGSGGLTSTNVQQGLSTVSQLLGFDPAQVDVQTTTTADTESEKAQAVMLTALSRMAQENTLGCNQANAGERAQCVVQTLAASAKLDTIKLQTSSGTDVSASLNTAVTWVFDENLNGNVQPTSLAVIQANLGCEGSGCDAAPVETGSLISAAKALFLQIRSDVMSLLTRGGASELQTAGAANQEAYKFRAALENVQAPADQFSDMVDGLQHGLDLYKRFKSGLTTQNYVLWGWSTGPGGGQSSRACSVYADTTLTVLATTPAEAVAVGCRTAKENYQVGLELNSLQVQQPRTRTLTYTYRIIPDSGTGFSYTMNTVKREMVSENSYWTWLINSNNSSERRVNETLGTLGGQTGTGTFDWADGELRSMSVTGGMPAMLQGMALYNPSGKSTVDMSASRAVAADGTLGLDLETVQVAGQIQVFRDGGSTLDSTMTVAAGSKLVYINDTTQASSGVSGGRSARLDLTWGNSASQVQGVLALDNGTLDKSGTRLAPTSWSFTGSLRNADASGVMKDVITGRLTVDVSDFAQYDAALAEVEGDSASNHFTMGFSFTGTLTAPSRPVLEVTMSTSMTSDQSTDPAAMALQYRSLVNGSPTVVVTISGTRDANTGLYHFQLHEATAALRMDWLEGATTADLYASDTLIGQFDSDSLLMTFVDHSFISLDTGL